MNCPDDGGSKPVRIFSSLMSLYWASYPARVVYFAVVLIKRRVFSDVGPVIVGRGVLDVWKDSSASFFSFQQSKKSDFPSAWHVGQQEDATNYPSKSAGCSYVHSIQ